MRKRPKTKILALALAISLVSPTMAEASEREVTEPVAASEETTRNTENNKQLIDINEEIIKTSPSEEFSLSFAKPELVKENSPAGVSYKISYSLDIRGSGANKPYTVSIFALKDSQVENISIDNFTGESSSYKLDKLEDTDILGGKLYIDIKDSTRVNASVRLDQDSKPGDYSLYYVVSLDGVHKLGKIPASLDNNYSLSLMTANKPGTPSYIINESNEAKDLSSLFAGLDDDSKVRISYINPNSPTNKREEIDAARSYELAPNSLAKIEIGKASDKEANNKSKSTQAKAPTGLIPLMKNYNKDSELDDEKLKEFEELVKKFQEFIATQEEKIEEVDSFDLDQIKVDRLTFELIDLNKEIRSLIKEALLYAEVESLEELEKSDPERAEAEYKKIAQLVERAQANASLVEDKLIELDEISEKTFSNEIVTVSKDSKTATISLRSLGKANPPSDLSSKISTIVGKVDTITLSPDKEEETSTNSYPILVNYLSSLNLRSKLLRPQPEDKEEKTDLKEEDEKVNKEDKEKEATKKENKEESKDSEETQKPDDKSDKESKKEDK